MDADSTVPENSLIIMVVFKIELNWCNVLLKEKSCANGCNFYSISHLLNLDNIVASLKIMLLKTGSRAHFCVICIFHFDALSSLDRL